MLPCVLIGDSIAVGVGQARPECETVAQVGITSARYVTTLLPPNRLDADLVVISLGVNDDYTVETLDNLRTVRGRMSARRVVWLLPGLKENVRAIIREVAAERGDRTLDTRPQVGRDNLHPTGAGYEQIAGTLIGPASGVEVAYAPADIPTYEHRPLRTLATPTERIKRLRGMRQSEMRQSEMRASGRTGSRTQAAHAPTRPGRVADHAAPRSARTSDSARPPVKPARQQGAAHAPERGRTTIVATCSGLSRSCAAKPRKLRG